MKYHPPITLIATLGTEPQVVTSGLDLLLQKGEPVRQVLVIHTSDRGGSIDAAVKVLQEAFSNRGKASSIRLELVPLLDEQGKVMSDVGTPAAAEWAFRALYRTVWQLKRSQERVHLLLAGGRKTLAVFAMVTAQLLFDEEDHLWHLFSSGDFLTSKRLHPEPGDDVHLVEVPVILWSRVTPVFETLRQTEDPYIALERIRELQMAEKVNESRSFVLGALSPAERRVVELLVREGMSDQELAGRLGLSARTIADHLRSAYDKAEQHWGISPVSRGQLIALLNLFYTTDSRNITDGLGSLIM